MDFVNLLLGFSCHSLNKLQYVYLLLRAFLSLSKTLFLVH